MHYPRGGKSANAGLVNQQWIMMGVIIEIIPVTIICPAYHECFVNAIPLPSRESPCPTGFATTNVERLSGHNAGDIAGLPGKNSILHVAECLSRGSSARCFVSISAGFCTPCTFRNWIIFCLAACCSHKALVSMCLNFPRPCRCMMPSAALASAYRRAPSHVPKSRASDRHPSNSAAALTVPYNSASADERATRVCIRDQERIKCEPCSTIPPLVDFRVERHPPQSVSL